MSVELSPSDQLTFTKPLKEVSKATLKITNKSLQVVAFKVKTTAPKLYCVRPNAGNIQPSESLEIQVLVQPFKDELTADQMTKCRDKFLVQTIELFPEEINLPPSDLWPQVESKRKEAIHEQKLRCVYISDNNDSIKPGYLTATDASPLTVLPSSMISTFTPASASSTSSALDHALSPPATSSTSKEVNFAPSVSRPSTTLFKDERKETSLQPNPSSTLVNQVPLNATGSFLRNESVPNTFLKSDVGSASWESEKQYYLDEIERLKKLVASKETTSSNGATIHTIVNPNYYSPQIVFIVAFISFLIGALLY